MDRRAYFFNQVVANTELVAGFDGSENADRAMMLDAAAIGILAGLGVAQHNSGDLNVVVASGVAYDKLGERVSVPTQQVVSLATDHLGVSTAVSGVSNSKIVSLFLKFARANSDPRVDGNSNPVNFVQNESFSFYVVQGAEAASSPTPPALLTDGILLADVTLVHSQTQILTADIATTGAARREDYLAIGSGIPHRVRRGQVHDALSDILDIINLHVSGTADVHPATAINYAGGASWAGGSSPTNPAATVEAQLDKIISDLAATATSASGADRIGIASRTTWLGGRANAATTLYTAVDKIITDLAATTSADDGAERIGAAAGPSSLAQGSVRSQLDDLDANWGKLSRSNTWGGNQFFDNPSVTTGNHYKVTSRSIGPRTAPAPIEIGGTNLVAVRTASIPAATSGYQPLDLPNGSTLTAVTVTVDPANATPPAGTQVGFKVTKRSMVDGSSTDVFATLLDPTAGASYAPVHSFTKSGLSEVIDRATYKYFVELVGESGTGSSSVVWYGSQWTATITQLDEGAA